MSSNYEAMMARVTMERLMEDAMAVQIAAALIRAGVRLPAVPGEAVDMLQRVMREMTARRVKGAEKRRRLSTQRRRVAS